jgi:hypothetical protein
MPETRITLRLLLWPEAMVTEERGTRKSLAKKPMQAALAFPSTGGAVTESLIVSPIWPVIAVCLARGRTFTAKLTLSSFSRIETLSDLICHHTNAQSIFTPNRSR